VSGNFEVGRIGDIVPGFAHGGDIESTTIGGLVTEWLGHVPKSGESIERDGIRLEILAGDEMRVERVRISRMQPEEAPESVGAEE
jgi:magnesium and cobalt transporter